MMWSIVYHYLVVKTDIPKLSALWRKKIQSAIEDKLITNPDLYGKPLRRSLAGYRKLRVGDYRVIFRIEEKIVKIFLIEHRNKVYEDVDKRIR